MKVLVLGGTSPIARALALRFANAGAHLYIAARDEAEAGRIAADLQVRGGVPVVAGTFDATDFASHEGLIAHAAAQLGGLDGVVLCFGTLGDEDRAQVEPEQAIATINQNYTGAVSLLTVAARRLEKQGTGFLLVLGSVAGDRGRKRNYVYGSAKGALHLFLQGLRARLAATKVQVTTVVLGTVDTRMTWGREGAVLTVPPEKAADLIFAAWRKKRDVVYVPWFWRPIMGVVRAIPERFFKHASF
ncbi:MAG TPA: SDR family NAD(P)-dependent oxidoreductase [Candidatus Binataceae bacterium]|nr:SDR family NAD(P)-dependent oxidoreductase [Candidatus Binataceae bacterium]